jgi:transposase InsO family protein
MVRREPNQNGYVESFHGRLRDECLNREQFWTLTEARVVTRGLPQRVLYQLLIK